MMKGFVFTVVFFVWIFWVLWTNSIYVRLDRACKPIEKAGNITTSVVLLFSKPAARATNKTFMHIDYGCEFTFWRLFFEDDYKAQELQEAQAQSSNRNVVGDDETPPADAGTR